MNFLFWNTARNDLRQQVTTAASELDLDFLILCEPGISGQQHLQAVSEVNPYHLIEGLRRRFCVLSRLSGDEVSILREDLRYLILEISPPGKTPFLLFCLHAPSRQANWTELGLLAEFAQYRHALWHTARQTEIDQLVVVGDFNANPFDAGLISTTGFHAIADAAIAEKETRKVQGTPYNYLYNPMWNLLGDRTAGPPGSHYYQGGTHLEYHWQMFDQVLLSPNLADRLVFSRLELLRQLGSHRLTTRAGRPRAEISDHFPLFFQIEFADGD